MLAQKMTTSLFICVKNIYTAIKATLTLCTPKQLLGSSDVGQNFFLLLSLISTSPILAISVAIRQSSISACVLLPV